MTRNDRMVGNVLGAVGSLPDIFIEIDVKFYLMRKLLGVKKEGRRQPSQKIALKLLTLFTKLAGLLFDQFSIFRYNCVKLQ